MSSVARSAPSHDASPNPRLWIRFREFVVPPSLSSGSVSGWTFGVVAYSREKSGSMHIRRLPSAWRLQGRVARMTGRIPRHRGGHVPRQRLCLHGSLPAALVDPPDPAPRPQRSPPARPRSGARAPGVDARSRRPKRRFRGHSVYGGARRRGQPANAAVCSDSTPPGRALSSAKQMCGACRGASASGCCVRPLVGLVRLTHCVEFACDDRSVVAQSGPWLPRGHCG